MTSTPVVPDCMERGNPTTPSLASHHTGLSRVGQGRAGPPASSALGWSGQSRVWAVLFRARAELGRFKSVCVCT